MSLQRRTYMLLRIKPAGPDRVNDLHSLKTYLDAYLEEHAQEKDPDRDNHTVDIEYCKDVYEFESVTSDLSEQASDVTRKITIDEMSAQEFRESGR